MRILMVSSYPPMTCGIGTYAAQQVMALREEGNVVDVCAPGEADQDFSADLRGGGSPLHLARLLWAYDRAVVHYVPNFFFSDESSTDRLKTSLSLLGLAVVFGRKIEWVIHETAYSLEAPTEQQSWRAVVDQWTWKLSKTVVLHSERERDAFAQYYNLSPQSPRLEVADHHRFFRPFAAESQPQARAELGIAEDRLLLLCIGFVQPHKGFDRVARAMKKIDSARAMLRIVGAVRVDWEPAKEYAKSLHELTEKDDRMEFVEGFVSDEDFDRWIIAADYVVVPYHEIWSSGVAARAALHETPIIVSASGALHEQAPEGSKVFESDEELESILRELLP